MDRESRLRDYLAQAKAAEEAAAKAKDQVTREAWLKIAESYRELAKGKTEFSPL